MIKINRKKLTNKELLNKISTADSLYSQKKYDEALLIYNEVLDKIDKACTYEVGELYRKTGNIFYFQKKYYNALQSYETCLKYCDSNASVYLVAARLSKTSNPEKAIKYYKRGLEVGSKPADISPFMRLLTKSHNYSQKQIKEITESLINKYRSAIFEVEKGEPFKHPKGDKNKKLHIGYLSGDFYSHAMMSFVLPILENHNKEKFDFTLFSYSPKEDSVTQRVKACGMKFVELEGLNYKGMAEKIYDEKIDILIDLTGYSRDSLFALLYKPAPIQMQYLGYLNTYGMKEVDYIWTDRFTIPENMAKYYTEKPFYIDCGMQRFSFNNKNLILPEITELPYKSNGFITFGSFNSISKINDYTVYLWSKLLKSIENSKLLIYRTQLNINEINALKKEFAKNEIPVERLIFDNEPCEGLHFNSYLLADIALDPMPFNGLTITIEQAMMGVGTLTLAGENLQAKGGARVNKALGLDEFIAYTEAEYIEKAKSLVNNLERLDYYRNNLRNIVCKSELLNDYKTFVQCIEDGFESVWDKYCNAL